MRFLLLIKKLVDSHLIACTLLLRNICSLGQNAPIDKCVLLGTHSIGEMRTWNGLEGKVAVQILEIVEIVKLTWRRNITVTMGLHNIPH